MVTIGIPFFNSEQFLAKSIQSVISQTYKELVIILIDDGSTDNSLNIAKNFAQKDKRIQVVSDGENKQLAYRLNQLANMSQTKFLARMDADDIMHPERIERQIQLLRKFPEIDVLGTNAYSINEKDEIQGLRISANFSRFELIKCNNFIHPSIIAKTEWFLKNPYDIKMIRVEDYELWLRTFSNNDFRVYTEPLLFYREFGVDFYKKYFNGFKSKIFIANKKRSSRLYVSTLRYILIGVTYRLFNILGQEQMLINKRFLKLKNEEKHKAEELLKAVLLPLDESKIK